MNNNYVSTYFDKKNDVLSQHGCTVAVDIGTPSEIVHGSIMSFHNITYTIGTKKMCCGSCHDVTRNQILNDVSGLVKPGVNVIMGSTGSGKTTLLDVLAGRKDPNCISGDVLLDGKPIPNNFQYISGYVIQNDLLVGMVTVRESLWFCANLRLPTSISHNEKRERIERILTELGLNSCADTNIGTEMTRGISGGERKRTSIALELILEPKILFLDETTTGLDAATAKSVMMLLRNLGDKGCTIVCSIHQPRYSIFKLFDFLTLLSAGNLIYHGESSKALEYFENLGYGCEPHENPADFFLDVLNGEYEEDSRNIKSIEGKDSFENKLPSHIIRLKSGYQTSYIYSFIGKELKKIKRKDGEEIKMDSKLMYATGIFHQLKILLARTAKSTIRNPAALLANIIINLITGLVFGLIYYQVDDSPGTGIQNRFGILFFICINLLFGSISVIANFQKNQGIYMHEHVSGYYRVISYYLAVVLADLIPLRTVSPIIFCSVTYWMVGLSAEVGAFLTFLFTCLLIAYASTGVGLFLSSTFQMEVANAILLLIYIFSIIFSGLLVNVGTIMPWISWIQYLSVTRYGLVGLSINELRGQNFTACGFNSSKQISSEFGFDVYIKNAPEGNDTLCATIRGEEFLYNTLSIGNNADDITDWNLWQNHLALGIMILILYLMSYVQFARLKKFHD